MADNPYYRNVKFFDALRRQSNPNWALAQRSKELNETLGGLLGTAQPAGQNAEGGGLFRSFTHDERDDRIRKISGQENPSYLKAVQDARTDNPLGDVFGEVGQGTPPGAAPVNLSERWQKIQEMLKSGDPLLQKAAMEQVPKELLPDAVAPKDLSGATGQWVQHPHIPGYQQWANIRRDAQGNVIDSTLIPELIRPKPTGASATAIANGAQTPHVTPIESIEAVANNIQTATHQRRLLEAMNTDEAKEALKKVGGLEGEAKAIWRLITGNQNAYDQMREKQTADINARIVGALPPGPASDHDIALFRKGFPGAMASADTIREYLRGSIKMHHLNALRERLNDDFRRSQMSGSGATLQDHLENVQNALQAEWENLNRDPTLRGTVIDRDGTAKKRQGEKLPSETAVDGTVMINGVLWRRTGTGRKDWEIVSEQGGSF